MMIQDIRQDRINALKQKDTIKRDLLGTLIAEACREVKEPSDEKVVGTVKKFISNIKETMKEFENHDCPQFRKLELELVILEGMLPKQMSEAAITKAVQDAIAAGANGMGSVMTYLKEHYAGRYDGASASRIAKAALAG